MEHTIIGVAGSGVMGGGIAQMFAEHGFQTLVWDTSAEQAATGVAAIRKRLDSGVAKGKLTAGEAAAILGRIRPVAALEELAPAAVVVEAVVEQDAVKRDLYRRIEAVVPPRTVIGTNTSSLGVTGLARALARPERFMGIHFFNPPTKLELVELVATEVLAPEVLAFVRDLLVRCGKSPVTVRDSPGFIVNRLLLPLINEAARLVDEGVAAPAEIDQAMRLGALHPAGPLQVADLIGLDVCLRILETLSRSLDNPFYRPARALVERVEAGRLGRKTGQGFYTY
ncbi:MAG: 3-hydroxyacyl-CoA dehydrogenase family protein [Lentisphaerae bacterium]|nr:3-hydroxyacyl-CoA dehydrogenase family protein [Lentisphaerota bacterium]